MEPLPLTPREAGTTIHPIFEHFYRPDPGKVRARLHKIQVIESHQKIIANLEKDMEDLVAARAKRQLA